MVASISNEINPLTSPSQTQIRQELQDLVLNDLLGPAGGENEIVDEQTIRDRSILGLLAPKGESAILAALNPELRGYDPESAAYAAFPAALEQLSGMGLGAADAADDLALALTYPRPDAYLAAQALLALGPGLTSLAIPVLIDNLVHPKLEARLYSAVLLGSLGATAACAVGDLAPLLWDADPQVRSAAALALELTSGQELVSDAYAVELDPAFTANAVSPDSPEGALTGAARAWWDAQGAQVDWRPAYGICDP